MYLCNTLLKMKDRIKNFIEAKGISAGELATVLDVQRSNISHILNGRNKPGASFIEKLLLEYPDLNARWLLTGEGSMFNEGVPTNNSSQQKLPITEEVTKQMPSIEKPKQMPSIEKPMQKNTVKEENIAGPMTIPDSDIDKMIIIYRDGTFNIFKQR